MSDDIVTRLRDSDGQGCTCEAYSYYECGCTEAVWAEMFIEEAADEIERLRRLADDLYETGDHKASCPPDEECTCGFTDAAYEYNKYATKLYKTEQVNNG